MKILFAGGGTLGPVTPLLAVARAVRRLKPETQLAWVGTPLGPERVLIERERIPFHVLSVAKWPRYPSWRWLTFPFDWATARVRARRLIKDLQPDAVVTAGGFTAVPLVIAVAKFDIPCFIHQLDKTPGLANRLIAKLGTVTTSFAYDIPPFGSDVITKRIATPVWINPETALSQADARVSFGLDPHMPTVLVFGGGTGSQFLNETIWNTHDVWSRWQLIHGTGLGKERAPEEFKPSSGYVSRSLFGEQMTNAYVAADVVVCRAGTGSLSEIAAFKKAAVIVPLPDSSQVENAREFSTHDAAIVLEQQAENFCTRLWSGVEELLNDPSRRAALGNAAYEYLPTDDGTDFAKEILER